MLLIWRGFGILVPLIAFSFVIATQAIVTGVGGQAAYTLNYRMYNGVSLVCAAFVIWFTGRHLNSRPRATYVNQATGAILRQGTRHSLFYIPMEYWAFAVLALAAASPYVTSTQPS